MTAHHGMNRHQMMRRHKRKLKEKYARSRWEYRDNIKLLQDEMEAEA